MARDCRRSGGNEIIGAYVLDAGGVKYISTDYFGLSFTSGVTYQIDVEGSPTGRGTLSDPFVTKGFTVGSPAVSDDDGGTGYNARLIWTASSSRRTAA